MPNLSLTSPYHDASLWQVIWTPGTWYQGIYLSKRVRLFRDLLAITSQIQTSKDMQYYYTIEYTTAPTSPSSPNSTRPLPTWREPQACACSTWRCFSGERVVGWFGCIWMCWKSSWDSASHSRKHRKVHLAPSLTMTKSHIRYLNEEYLSNPSLIQL